MSILQVQTIPKHSYTLIAVPSERLEKPASDYTEIESEGQSFKIVQKITIQKSERMPTSLTLLATGKSLEYFEIWSSFKNSDRIVFFICDKL